MGETYRPSDPSHTPGLGEYQSEHQFWTQVNDPTLPPGHVKWFNSQTGEYYIDTGQGGGAGGQGSSPGSRQNTTNPYWWMRNMQGPGGQEFNQWEGNEFEAPAGWEAPDIGIPEAGVDIRAIVESRRHLLDEEMGGQMSASARRLGAGGMLAGSEYVDELGQAERSRDLDLAALYYDYDYRAAQSDADRRSTARENILNRSLSAWDTHGGWEQDANMFGSGQDFQAWMAENAFNERSYDDQMAWLESMMPMLMAGGGENINWSQFWN
jgi:hypothetical protein